MSNPDAVTGIAWYRRDEWARLRELATDADRLEEDRVIYRIVGQEILVEVIDITAHDYRRK